MSWKMTKVMSLWYFVLIQWHFSLWLTEGIIETANRPFVSCLFAGFKFRRRTITNYPTGGEGNCPHLVEAIPCDDPSCFSWQLVKLEECIPEEDMDCGEGTQTPQVRCINSNGIKHRFTLQIKSLFPIWTVEDCKMIQ